MSLSTIRTRGTSDETRPVLPPSSSHASTLSALSRMEEESFSSTLSCIGVPHVLVPEAVAQIQQAVVSINDEPVMSFHDGVQRRGQVELQCIGVERADTALAALAFFDDRAVVARADHRLDARPASTSGGPEAP